MTEIPDSWHQVEEFKKEVKKDWIKVLCYPPYLDIPINLISTRTLVRFWTVWWSQWIIAHINILRKQTLSPWGIRFGSLEGLLHAMTPIYLVHLATSGSWDMYCLVPWLENWILRGSHMSWIKPDTASKFTFQTRWMSVIIKKKMEGNHKRFVEWGWLIFSWL